MSFEELRKKINGKNSYIEKYNIEVDPLVQKLEKKLKERREGEEYYIKIKKQAEEKNIEAIKKELDGEGTKRIKGMEKLVSPLKEKTLEIGKSNKKLKIVNEEIKNLKSDLYKKEDQILDKEVKKIKKIIKDEEKVKILIQYIKSEKFREINIKE